MFVRIYIWRNLTKSQLSTFDRGQIERPPCLWTSRRRRRRFWRRLPWFNFPDVLFLVVFVLRRLESMDVVVRDVEADLNGG